MLNDYGNPFVKWDCPINQKGYVETVRATAKFLNFYTKCRSDQAIRNKLI